MNEFGTDIVGDDDSYFNDYGQLWNTRQFLKDFAPDLTKSLDAQTYKNKLERKDYMQIKLGDTIEWKRRKV